MTNNPLIAKYEELYHPKKEEPKLPRIEEVEETYELPPEWNTKGITTPSVATSNTGITKANHIPKLVSYDPHSAEGYFLEVAEKIKNKDAKVTSVGIERDCVGVFSTGIQTITFEVQMWDTP